MSNIEQYKKIYPAHLVVMQNRILEAYSSMSLDEKRVIVLASAKARMMDATEKDAIRINVAEYAQECMIKESSAYSQLDDASQAIMNRQFSYKNERGQRVRVNWVIRTIYNNGAISLCFSDEVLFMLKVFDEHNPFTRYPKKEVLKLRGEYAIDLYHLIKKNQNKSYKGKKGVFVLNLDTIKTELHTPKSYNRINNLKARAIQPAIDEINEKTSLQVEYANHKEGARVTGLLFKVKDRAPKEVKDNTHKDATNSIKGLSDAQIARIARSEQFKTDYNHMISPNSPINNDYTGQAWVNHFVKEIKKDASKFSKRPIKDYLDY